MKQSKEGVQKRMCLLDACCSGVRLVTAAVGGLGSFFDWRCDCVNDSRSTVRMVGSAFCPKLNCNTPPNQVIIRIWNSLHLTDLVYVINIVGDLPVLAHCPVS
ncbi:hypothetical protein CDL15_Pgr026202 [Punica granatum]|uniref:Uncharacterized protein n=1 Tax=Punica granatum TaxID=22663 RepID=A0A218VS52_PUNGR|nr:hypothetical protein CDL15_Pgr026202 [Punica granatum]